MNAGRVVRGATWIDPEEYAYPEGSLRQSRRRGLVKYPDGKLRTVVLGVPDTFFTIPARGKAHGRTFSGYVSCDESGFTFNARNWR